MPHYFLDFRIAGDFLKDQTGAEFPDIAHARREAILAARELVAERVLTGVLPLDVLFEVKDQWGMVLDMVPLEAAVRLERPA
jgi:hypothetical protein